MFKQLSTDTLNWIFIVGVILFIIELTFFQGGMIIPALFFALLIYIGRQRFSKLWGKLAFWGGIVGVVFSVLNMLAVRFLVIAAIVIFIINYSKSKKEAKWIKPELSGFQEEKEELVSKRPLFYHRLFADQRTDEIAYEWRDINIHGAFGDRVIDLSNTVLPNDTAVISIRHLVGNIEIYVPYEVEISIQHSSIIGRALILGKYHDKLMNQTLLYQTEGYDKTYPRVKIITSLASGDIEVKRI
ncbi:cell wall-active antibiotics response protein LiaF [Cerasibacillus sp. JNUCC 74]|jgi:lia operon protein LiaF|uniref:cell wall-active antibiotics response protein LiaF n=1 Tax=Virgibacillus proomii TaxID=84407 RepID=UPI0009869B85|nr:cell wall-active antibiotics response protein LiaF [Virgibacillus proomii]